MNQAGASQQLPEPNNSGNHIDRAAGEIQSSEATHSKTVQNSEPLDERLNYISSMITFCLHKTDSAGLQQTLASIQKITEAMCNVLPASPHADLIKEKLKLANADIVDARRAKEHLAAALEGIKVWNHDLLEPLRSRATDPEIAAFISERGQSSSFSPYHLLSTWDGHELTIKAATYNSAQSAVIYREQITLPPDIGLEVMPSNGIIRLYNNSGLAFNDSNSPTEILFNKGTILTNSGAYHHLFLKPIIGQKESAAHLPVNHTEPLADVTEFYHFSLERYKSVSLHAGVVCHSGGGVKSVQNFINTDLRNILENVDFATYEAEIQTDRGPVKVMGPSRYGEVYLNCFNTNRYQPYPLLQIYYNPTTEELRVTDLQDQTLKVVGGSVKSGKFQVEVMGREQADFLEVTLVPNNRFAFDSVIIKWAEPSAST